MGAGRTGVQLSEYQAVGIDPMNVKYGMSVEEKLALEQYQITHKTGTVGLSSTREELMLRIAKSLYKSQTMTNMFGRTTFLPSGKSN